MMPAGLRLIAAGILVLLLAACGSQPINAPVGTRSPQKTAKPVIVRPSAARTAPGYYLVGKGDTLYSIAWQYGLSFQQLAAMNSIRRPYTIYVGQRLRVKPRTSKGSSKSPSAPVTQTAQKPGPAPGRKTSKPAGSPQAKPVIRAPASKTAAVNHWVWPVRGSLLRSFNPNAPGKKGIDINGRRGQPVMAAADGKVVYTGSGLVGYGQLIIIKHNDSLLSAYGHNSKLLVREGELVKAGQVIANMGSSGTNRTQLYFEIRKDGKPVNPLHYLPGG